MAKRKTQNDEVWAALAAGQAEADKETQRVPARRTQLYSLVLPWFGEAIRGTLGATQEDIDQLISRADAEWTRATKLPAIRTILQVQAVTEAAIAAGYNVERYSGSYPVDLPPGLIAWASSLRQPDAQWEAMQRGDWLRRFKESERTYDRRIGSGEIRSVKRGSLVAIHPDDVTTYFRAQ